MDDLLPDNPPGLTPEIEPKKHRQITPKGVSGNPLGRAVHKRVVEEFDELPPKEQAEVLRSTWRSISMGVAQRAKAFVTTCTPKEFGRLYHLVQASAVALDRAFPEKKEVQTPHLIVNLFSSLGSKAGAIATPETPKVIEVKSGPIPDSAGESTT